MQTTILRSTLVPYQASSLPTEFEAAKAAAKRVGIGCARWVVDWLGGEWGYSVKFPHPATSVLSDAAPPVGSQFLRSM